MSGRRIYIIIRHKLSRLLNPALCLSCGIPVSVNDFLCQYCFDSLDKVVNPCRRCGLENMAGGDICPACRFSPPRWNSMTSPLVYSGVTRKLIHEFKYSEHIHHANALITHLIQFYQRRTVEVLIPVPLHRSRLLERGFNQSEEIARILSDSLDIPLDRTSLIRIKATDPQSGLSLNKRRMNIRKAFRFDARNNYTSVAIVDDIITTGSTLSEITRVLKRSGIKHVEVWSLARALKND